MKFSGDQGKMIHEKTLGQKSCDTVPLNSEERYEIIDMPT